MSSLKYCYGYLLLFTALFYKAISIHSMSLSQTLPEYSFQTDNLPKFLFFKVKLKNIQFYIYINIQGQVLCLHVQNSVRACDDMFKRRSCSSLSLSSGLHPHGLTFHHWVNALKQKGHELNLSSSLCSLSLWNRWINY